MQTLKLILSILAIIIVAPFLWWSWSQDPPPRPKPSTAEVTRANATGTCRDTITSMLHDPASAEWQPRSQWMAGRDKAGSGRYFVQTEVRARNSFGGLVLTRFQCTLTGEGDDMVLTDIREY